MSMKVAIPRMAVLSGPHRLRVDPVPGAVAPDPSALLGFLRDLSDIAKRGGFSPDGQTGGREFAIARVGSERTSIIADLQLDAIDARFVQCLASALASSGAEAELAEITLSPDDGAEVMTLPPPEDFTGGAVYPELRDRLAFPLTTDPSVISRMRRLVVTLGRTVSRTEIDAVAEWVRPWGAVLDAGGFVLLQDFPGETSNVYSGVQLFERDSVEIVVDRFDSDEEAFDILLNMLDTFAASVMPITSVELF